jgi:hypothetical protein
MTYEELLLKTVTSGDTSTSMALEAVVKLHKPKKIRVITYCDACTTDDELVSYPCQTIWAIENILG